VSSCTVGGERDLVEADRHGKMGDPRADHRHMFETRQKGGGGRRPCRIYGPRPRNKHQTTSGTLVTKIGIA